MRISSINPLKKPPRVVVPPIRNGLVDETSAPGSLRVATSAPLTYTRTMAPSNVTAICDQAFNGIDVDDDTRRSWVTLTPTTGRKLPSEGKKAYARSPAVSFAIAIARRVPDG